MKLSAHSWEKPDWQFLCVLHKLKNVCYKSMLCVQAWSVHKQQQYHRSKFSGDGYLTWVFTYTSDAVYIQLGKPRLTLKKKFCVQPWSVHKQQWFDRHEFSEDGHLTWVLRHTSDVYYTALETQIGTFCVETSLLSGAGTGWFDKSTVTFCRSCNKARLYGNLLYAGRHALLPSSLTFRDSLLGRTFLLPY